MDLHRGQVWKYALSIFFLFFVGVSNNTSAATVNHTYDDLNCLVQTVYENGAKMTTITYTYDAAGNMLSFQVTSNFLAGDIDNNQAVGLADAILALQIAAGISPPSTIYKEADLNGDGKIGIIEAIYILQKTAGLR